jgi:hypothetical protein
MQKVLITKYKKARVRIKRLCTVGATRKKHAKIIVPSYIVLPRVALANNFEAIIFNNRCNKIYVKFILRIEAFRVGDKGLIYILRECFIGGLSTTV